MLLRRQGFALLNVQDSVCVCVSQGLSSVIISGASRLRLVSHESEKTAMAL